MEKAQDENILPSQLITEQIIANPIFPNFTGIEFAEPWPSPRKAEQFLWRLAKFSFNLGRENRVVMRNEINQAINVIASLMGPPYRHAARGARDRALRLAAKCLSASSCDKVLPSSTDFIASNVSS